METAYNYMEGWVACEEWPLFLIMVTLRNSYTGVLQSQVSTFPGFHQTRLTQPRVMISPKMTRLLQRDRERCISIISRWNSRLFTYYVTYPRWI